MGICGKLHVLGYIQEYQEIDDQNLAELTYDKKENKSAKKTTQPF